jgi:hypothetical protein
MSAASLGDWFASHWIDCGFASHWVEFLEFDVVTIDASGRDWAAGGRIYSAAGGAATGNRSTCHRINCPATSSLGGTRRTPGDGFARHRIYCRIA